MGDTERLAEAYREHIVLPWQEGISGAQRVIMAVYEKDQERRLRARLNEFEIATHDAGYEWRLIDISDVFGAWLAREEEAYRTAYFESPEDLRLKLDAEFTGFVAARIREQLEIGESPSRTVVAVVGVGALYGFTRVTGVLRQLEPHIRGRLLIFFPGTLEGNNYRLLDARDGWNYLAVPITLHGTGAASC
jgi:Domain of unknown function (DUF1788)